MKGPARLSTRALAEGTWVPGFTLVEMVVVLALILVLTALFAGRIASHGDSAALQSAQSLLANTIATARSKAMTSGAAARVLVHFDVTEGSGPPRFLRCLAVQVEDAGGGWVTHATLTLPAGIYVVPGKFPTTPAGLFVATEGTQWMRVGGSEALRSTALRSDQLVRAAIDGFPEQQWASLTIASTGGTLQTGDLVLARGRARPPGTFSAGESPVQLEHPASVRGLSISQYGVASLIDDRASF